MTEEKVDHNEPFGRHNLDHLHDRVASGMPNSRKHVMIEAIVAHLEKLGEGAAFHLWLEHDGWSASVGTEDTSTKVDGLTTAQAAMGVLVDQLT